MTHEERLVDVIKIVNPDRLTGLTKDEIYVHFKKRGGVQPKYVAIKNVDGGWKFFRWQRVKTKIKYATQGRNGRIIGINTSEQWIHRWVDIKSRRMKNVLRTIAWPVYLLDD